MELFDQRMVVQIFHVGVYIMQITVFVGVGRGLDAISLSLISNIFGVYL